METSGCPTRERQNICDEARRGKLVREFFAHTPELSRPIHHTKHILYLPHISGLPRFRILSLTRVIVSSGITLRRISSNTSFFIAICCGLVGYTDTLATLLKDLDNDSRPHVIAMCLLVGDRRCLDLLRDHIEWIFSDEPILYAELLVDVPEGDIRRIVLEEAHTGMARDRDWYVEMQVAFVAFFLA